MTDPRIEAAARSIWMDMQDAGTEIAFENASTVNRAMALSLARNALAAADAAAWRPIESAPKNGTLILVPVKHIGCDVVGWWCEGWRETTNGLVLRDEPTCWQPLPAPPKDEVLG